MNTPNEITLVLADRGFLLSDYEVFDLDPSQVEITVDGSIQTLDQPEPAATFADHASALKGHPAARATQAVQDVRDEALDGVGETVMVSPASAAEAIALARRINAKLNTGAEGSRYVPSPEEVRARAAALQHMIENSVGPVKGFNVRSRIFADRYRMLSALKAGMDELVPERIPPYDAVIHGVGGAGVMEGCAYLRILRAPDGWVVRHTFMPSQDGPEVVYRMGSDTPGVEGQQHRVRLPRFPGMAPMSSTVSLFLKAEEVVQFVSELVNPDSE